MSTPKKIDATILKITVANGETVLPGQKVSLIESDFRLLKRSEKAKEYEAGDEKKYAAKVEPKKEK